MNKKRTWILGVIVTAAIILILSLGIKGADKNKEDDQPRPEETLEIPVTLIPAGDMLFIDRVSVAGNVEAKNYALVSARISGALDHIFVDEGDLVTKGETPLFQTDSLNLKKALDIAEQELLVSDSNLKERRANLEKEQADLELKESDLKRYKNLFKKNVVSSHDLEEKESEFKQAKANVKLAMAQVELAGAQKQQANFRKSMAGKNLEDSLVIAPISGRVSRRLKEPGEMAAAGTPVLKIENLDTLEASFFLPEEYYPRINAGKTAVRLLTAGVDLGTKTVTYKSPTVTEDLRTFEVKCLLESPPAGVVPGRIVHAGVILESHRALGVPRDSIELRDGKSVVFTVENRKAKGIVIQTGLETDGWLEVSNGELKSGDPIINMGQNFVEQGTPVSIVKEAD